MATISLLAKDLREHGLAALALLFGALLIILVALLQNQTAAYSMSPFEVVRFTLLTLFPLCLLYTSPSPRDLSTSRMPSSA